MFFLPGFVLRKVLPGDPDPITGEPGKNTIRLITGRGIVQESLWTNTKETTLIGVRDERLLMFVPGEESITDLEITAADEFMDSDQRLWQCITDGYKRGIPGRAPEYIAVRVRRAKGKK
ncbi:hypothetical protein ACFLIN_03765 [Corynebacterium kutscheri]|uniref:hypothetical protein n=1 Tax=Corynebacterium kutscheri TaxID=35755 RepID=UPI0037BEB03C